MTGTRIQIGAVIVAALIIAMGATVFAFAQGPATVPTDEASNAAEVEEAEKAIPADAASISEDAAVSAASAKAEGSVVSVELDDEGGKIVYEVAFDSGTEVAVDADTGTVLEVENGETED